MRILLVGLLVLVSLQASAFFEAASTYDPRRGRYVSTEEYKRDYNVREVCQTASCWDSKSGHFVSGSEFNERRREEGKREREDNAK